jgi:release factor glutamine methyltransferase
VTLDTMARTSDAVGGADSAGALSSIGAVVREVQCILTTGRVDDPWADARDIVSILLDVPRGWPGMYGDRIAETTLGHAARVAADRRVRGMPLPYAVGRAAFRHLTLHVDDRVLIPRPETEGLVDLVLGGCQAGGLAIDVGTGSGAIALALAHEGRFERVIGTDISQDALAVAAANGRRLRPALSSPVEFRAGAYLAPVRGLRARAIVYNPPYISWAEAVTLPSAVRDWEPPVALFTGETGMAATTAVVREAAAALEPGGMLVLEVDARRASLVVALIARDNRYAQVELRSDLFGRDRFVTAVRRTGT